MFTLLNEQKMTSLEETKLFAENLPFLNIYKIAFSQTTRFHIGFLNLH